MIDAIHGRRNALLATLPDPEWARLSLHLEPTYMARGQVVHESNAVQRYVYFPADCIVSLLYLLKDGTSDEVAIIGSEGMVGVATVMSGNSTPSRAVVRRAGFAWRIEGEFFRDEFEHAHALQLGLLRYSQALLTQIAQIAVCNRHHTVDQQLSRWLLMSLDRLPSSELNMTHEGIASMLGVRREAVTEAAGKLQRAGVIRYSRGHIQVLARRELEDTACECYDVVRREWDRLWPNDPEPQSVETSVPDRRWRVRSSYAVGA